MHIIYAFSCILSFLSACLIIKKKKIAFITGTISGLLLILYGIIMPGMWAGALMGLGFVTSNIMALLSNDWKTETWI